MSDQPTDPIRLLAEKIYGDGISKIRDDEEVVVAVKYDPYEYATVERDTAIDAIESILRREGVRVDGPGELWPGMRVEVTKAISGRGTLIEPQQRCWYIDHEKFGRIPIPEAHLKPLPDAAEKGEVK